MSTELDVVVARFTEGVERAAVSAYEAAVRTGLLKGADLRTAKAFAAQHQAHAAAFGAYAGDGTRAVANPKLRAAYTSRIGAARSERAVLEVAYELENAVAATHLLGIGELQEPRILELTATVLPVESQHAVVWGTVLGYALDKQGYLPAFLTTAGALGPADHPARPGT
ncbi:MAG TPA: ferritin-like domain-containing protein [Acidimicrobiales bacterium]|nr:ferritin-like domain-containing protein [Acidimicrobiales bacterium]